MRSPTTPGLAQPLCTSASRLGPGCCHRQRQPSPRLTSCDGYVATASWRLRAAQPRRDATTKNALGSGWKYWRLKRRSHVTMIRICALHSAISSTSVRDVSSAQRSLHPATDRSCRLLDTFVWRYDATAFGPERMACNDVLTATLRESWSRLRVISIVAASNQEMASHPATAEYTFIMQCGNVRKTPTAATPLRHRHGTFPAA